ncbi:MAG: hypothetical protein AB1656_22585 [Candidatus Omnitrophota bacterium]
MKIRIIIAIGVYFFLGVISAGACMPEFPHSFIPEGEEALILSLSSVTFYDEFLQVVKNQSHLPAYNNKSGFNLYFYEGAYSRQTVSQWQNTLDADLGDLKAGLAKAGIAPVSAEAFVKEYEALRRNMKIFADRSEDQDSIFPCNFQEKKEKFDFSPYEELFEKIPKEFVLYVKGAAEYRANDGAAAQAHWRELLELPKEQRAYRSVWAAFMMGKAQLAQDDSQAAVESFQLARALAAEGFRDSLNLSGASVGWQARAEKNLGRYAQSLRHYYEVFDSSEDPWISFNSFFFLCRTIFQQNIIDEELAKDPLCRKIVSAWVISSKNNYSDNIKWLETIVSSDVKPDASEADQLAWIAYDAGYFDIARRWLSMNEEHNSYGKWALSKLLLRDGKIDEAMKILQSLVKVFPNEKTEYKKKGERKTILSEDRGFSRFGDDKVHAELGLLRLGRKEFVEALDAFARSGYWEDAAYVAERVLTVQELEAYVKRNQNDPVLTKKRSINTWYSGEIILDHLKWLLARCYARERQWDKARPYYPKKMKKIFDEFVAHWRAGEDKRNSNRMRAKHFYAAGMLAKKYGMELMGTELAPDYAVYRGHFHGWPSPEPRIKDESDSVIQPPALAQALAAKEEEKKSVLKTIANNPDKRFHYRWVAADLMKKCSLLLPDNDELTARALYEGAYFIIYDDLDMAQWFYKNLVRRCRQLPIGQEADERRWFPPHYYGKEKKP